MRRASYPFRNHLDLAGLGLTDTNGNVWLMLHAQVRYAVTPRFEGDGLGKGSVPTFDTDVLFLARPGHATTAHQELGGAICHAKPWPAVARHPTNHLHWPRLTFTLPLSRHAAALAPARSRGEGGQACPNSWGTAVKSAKHVWAISSPSPHPSSRPSALALQDPAGVSFFG